MPQFESKSPFKHPWWVPFQGLGETYPCLDERLIVQISNQIRAKPDWTTKYKNLEIAAKWKKELKEQKLRTEHLDEVFDFVLKELEWYEKVESTMNFKVGPDHRIVYGDSVIDRKIRDDFFQKFLELEEQEEKDYHPDSDDLVVDWVHPSMYHLQYLWTMVLEDGELKEAIFDEGRKTFKEGLSGRGVEGGFQWLPAEMKLDPNGKFVFDSYINNLHPFHYEELYLAIEDIFNQIIPGWNYTLARYLSPEYIRVHIPDRLEAYNDKWKEYEDRLRAFHNGETVEDEDEMLNDRKKYLGKFPPH